MTALLERRKSINKSKFISTKVTGKTCYIEMQGSNRVIYRVTEGHAVHNGEEYTAYGIEAEKKTGLIRVTESIEDFSREQKTAVAFAEMLLKYSVKPSFIYNAALSFLYENMEYCFQKR